MNSPHEYNLQLNQSKCHYRCVSNCSNGVEKAQRYVQSELERVQGRLQRCVMDCNDSVKDKMPPNPNETEIGKGNSFPSQIFFILI